VPSSGSGELVLAGFAHGISVSDDRQRGLDHLSSKTTIPSAHLRGFCHCRRRQRQHFPRADIPVNTAVLFAAMRSAQNACCSPARPTTALLTKTTQGYAFQLGPHCNTRATSAAVRLAERIYCIRARQGDGEILCRTTLTEQWKQRAVMSAMELTTGAWFSAQFAGGSSDRNRRPASPFTLSIGLHEYRVSSPAGFR